MLGCNAISRHSRLGLDFDGLGFIFMTLAPLLESIWWPWAHFWSTLDALFVAKNSMGCQRCPKRHHPEIKPPILEIIFHTCLCFWCKKERTWKTLCFQPCSAEHGTHRTQLIPCVFYSPNTEHTEHRLSNTPSICVQRTQPPNTPNTIRLGPCSPNTGAEHTEHRTRRTLCSQPLRAVQAITIIENDMRVDFHHCFGINSEDNEDLLLSRWSCRTGLT